MIRTQSKLRFAFAPASIIAVLYGLLDSLVWVFGYDYGAYFALYYAIAVPCKAAILVIFMRTARFNNARILQPFYVPIGITVFVSMIQGTSTFAGVTQPIGVIGSLALTIAVLSAENVTAYMKAFGVSCLMACLTFLFQVHAGDSLLIDGGRYTFIYGTQPNLGGEILFTGFIAFCIGRSNPKLIFATFALYFYALNLLQARSALLSMLIAFFVYVYVDKIRRFAPINRVAIIAGLGLMVVCYFAFNMETVSHLFLLDDEYRGVGTGFVGREEHWEIALNTFAQYPLFGVGFGFFREGVPTPHSMWLSMLSMMGAMCFFIVLAMLKNGWRIYLANKMVFLFLLTFIPMTIFNDRFINLNPYPLLFFVILFLPSSALKVSVLEYKSRAVRKRGFWAKRDNQAGLQRP